MANDQLVLQINKINISPDKSYVKYNQNERGKVIDINVIDNDGINAYDLTNKKIRFVDDKEDNKLVLDDEADNPGHFTRTADAQGKFSYIFHDLVYQRSGIARFEIYTDSEHIDATANFEIQIENTSSLVAVNESYISSLEGLVAHHRSTIDTTETETNQLIDSLNKQIAQAISDGNKSVADEVSSIKEIIQQMQTEYNSKSDALAKLTSDWQTQTQTIQNSADDQLKKINENANSEIDKLKQDADSQLKTNQENATAALTKINQDAADQLKSNQTANDAEINSVKQQLSDEIGRIETAKQDAIKAVSDAKDQAILAANKAYKDQLGAFQTDYDTWKNTTVADFQKQLDKLNQEITTETNTQNDLKQSVSDAVNTMQIMMKKLDGYDFTKFVTSEQIKNYPTKDEVKVMMDNAGKVKTVDNIQPDNNGNVQTNHYTKQEIDGIKQNILDTITNKTKNMATTQDVAVNAQSITSLENVVDGKADKATVFLKTDADSLKNQLESEISNAGKLKTISIDGGTPTTPDTSGNVNIDLSKKADASSLQALDSRVTALENKPGDIVAVTQAQYDQLVKDGKVQQNVIYAVSNS